MRKGNPAARWVRKADGPLWGGRATEQGEIMRRYIGLLAVASVVLTVGFLAPQERASSEPNSDNGMKPGLENADFAPGRILVKIKDEAPADAIEAVNQKNYGRVEEKIPHSRVNVVHIPDDLSVTEAVERYENVPDVEYAEPDYKINPARTVNDPKFPKMYDLKNTGQYDGTKDSDIDAPRAWNVTIGRANTIVAVIDTGVDINHPDLRDNIWTNPDEKPNNGRDDDRNGYIDDVHGWDFRNEDNSVFDSATDDHGTHVAGTIAAEGNNGIGVTGVNWRAKVMPLKFIGPETGYTSDAVQALNYAVDNGVKISNNSWGGGSVYSQTLFDAISRADAAGHLFVAAAGNNGSNSDRAPAYPASYHSPNIVSVAASDQNDKLMLSSNYGATSVDLAAPGLFIYSTLPGNAYGYNSGTSMAAPHVAGAAALLKSAFPELGDAGIKARLLRSVDRKKNLQGKVVSDGRLNAARALGVKVPR